MGSFNKILHNKNFLILAVTTLCSVLVLTMAVNNCNFIISTTETDFSDSIDLQPLAGATLTIDTNGTVHGYHSGDTVQINALFEYLNGTPIQNGNISYEIDDPSGSPIFIDLGLTDANGQNSTTYTLNPSASEGTYTVYVVGDKNNGQFNDTAQTIFYVDNTPPNLTYTNPSVNGTDITISPNIWINGTAFGTISNVSRVLINDTRFGIGITGVPQVDPSGTSGGNFAFRNNTVLGSGTYAVKVTVTDDAGNTNSSVIWFTLSYVDTNPPQASNPRPPNGGYGPDGVTIMVDLTDDISGINASTIVLTVEGVVRSHSWNGTTVSWTAGSGLFANGQVIDVSVDASDNAGNTMATYSWSFTMDLVAPVASNPDPANGGYTSDTTPTIVVALSDALSGVDGSSITLRVEGSGVSHTFNGTHVYYTPSVPFSDGQVINVDLDASDNVGNAMATYSWSFTIDTSAPTASNENPANGAYTSDSTPTITVMLSDSGSGIDSSSIQMKVESTSVSYTWNGTHVSYTPSSAFANGQIVDVTVDALDNVGNAMATYSWSFTVDTAPPVASNPSPANGGYTNDPTPTIVIALSDALSGIDSSSIVMTVESSVVGHTFNGTHVFYTPSTAFANGQVIDVTLDASDNVGNAMATYSWSFTIDTAAPVASNPDPANGAYTNDATPTITLALSDALSDVDASSIVMQVESSVVLHTWNGTHVSYTPSSAFSNGQVINVSVDASDNAGNVMATYSWSFTIDTAAPVASNPSPSDGSYTNDTTPIIVVALSDALSGVNASSIILRVESSVVLHTWNGTHVSYTPSTAFADGQVVNVDLNASDNAGNAMATYSWSFTIDTSPPTASNENPANGAYTSDSTPTITVRLTDAGSGVDSSSIQMRVESLLVSHNWNGTHVSYTPSSAFSNGQVIDVSVDASDNLGNAMATYSWSFTIDTAPPVASNPSPPNGGYTSDTTPTIIIALSDALSGVDSSSIAMTVEGSTVIHTWNDTHVSYTPSTGFTNGQVIDITLNASDNVGNAMATYSWSFTIDTAPPVASNPSPSNGGYTNDATPTIVVALSDALSGVNSSSITLTVESSVVSHNWNGTHVIYTPGSAFADGQVINVDLDASDNAGNAMATYSWSFTIDISAPSASNEKPVNNGYTNDSTPTITVALSDSLSGIDSSTITMTVEGSTVSYSWNGTHVSYTPSSAFANGQVVNVAVNVSDNAGNTMPIYSWSFTVDIVPPNASNESPANQSTTSDTQPTISIYLSDALSGVDASTIIFIVNGTNIPSANYTYNALSGLLSYTPTSPYSEGKIDVAVRVRDNAGNLMPFYNWTFNITIGRPYCYNPIPADGAYVGVNNPVINVTIDGANSINPSTIIFKVEGSVVSFTWSNWTGNALNLSYQGSGYVDGQVINCEIENASDYSGNWMLTPYVWSFTVDLSAPQASNPSPQDGAYTSDATPTITIDLSDAYSGINSSTIVLTVEGSAVTHSWDGSTVSYTPSTPFANGQVINVSLDASDNVGNAMATYSWAFTIDTAPPVASNPSPANGAYVSNTDYLYDGRGLCSSAFMGWLNSILYSIYAICRWTGCRCDN
ncbi:MAG: Ig-like domain-containing protein [Candidatus Helarchaeota archaeon]